MSGWDLRQALCQVCQVISSPQHCRGNPITRPLFKIEKLKLREAIIAGDHVPTVEGLILKAFQKKSGSPAKEGCLQTHTLHGVCFPYSCSPTPKATTVSTLRGLQLPTATRRDLSSRVFELFASLSHSSNYIVVSERCHVGLKFLYFPNQLFPFHLFH